MAYASALLFFPLLLINEQLTLTTIIIEISSSSLERNCTRVDKAKKEGEKNYAEATAAFSEKFHCVLIKYILRDISIFCLYMHVLHILRGLYCSSIANNEWKIFRTFYAGVYMPEK